MTRRTALQTLLALAVTRPSAAASSMTPVAKPTLHAYADYRWLRGFSVIPSWGARIEDAWWFYDPARMREEIAPARQMHANCIRLWIEFTAWMRDPGKVTAAFLDAVSAIAEAGMKTMPCLFNRWHDNRYDYGGTYTETLFRDWGPQMDYLRTIVTPLAADDRILIWDLCNEPQAGDVTGPVNKQEIKWLTAVASTVRACGARQPVTIGTMTGPNVDIYAPLVDVMCAHPYAHDREGLIKQVAALDEQRKRHGKPLLVNETIPGCLDDRKRAETARFFTEILSEARMGWMGWALREGLAISTRRDRYDSNGVNGEGFHPFVTKAGHLREGLEFLTEKPKLLPPWQS